MIDFSMIVDGQNGSLVTVNTGAGYQRSLDIQMPRGCDHHVLTAESVVGAAAPALVDVGAQFVRP